MDVFGPLMSKFDARLASVESRSPFRKLDEGFSTWGLATGAWGCNVSPNASKPPDKNTQFISLIKRARSKWLQFHVRTVQTLVFILIICGKLRYLSYFLYTSLFLLEIQQCLSCVSSVC